jgi:hypothetical protein
VQPADQPDGRERSADVGDAGRDAQLDAAFAAYLRLCDAAGDGDQWVEPDEADRRQRRDDFLARYPELQPELEQLIITADLLQRFVGEDNASTGRELPHDAETIGAGQAHVSPAEVRLGTGEAAGQFGDKITQQIAADPDNATLPVSNRPAHQSGPRLPYELGDYLLEEMIGRGGMGMVYRAKQKGLQRDVAVKMIRSGVFAGEAEVRRFRIEAQAAASLQHPNIVTVHHSGYLDGHHYFSMDYVPGTDLSRRMAQGPLEIDQAARYVRDCAQAIHYAHERGILHRDLKPANILIDAADQVRITDFGLAKHTDTESSITGSGAAVGTPNYMAPEQALGHGDRADQTADVYSLGAVLYAVLTGEPPFAGETVVQTLLQVVHRTPTSPRSLRPELPVELESIVLKCLEKDPRQRYGSAQELGDDLQRFLEGRPVRAKALGPLQKIWFWVNDVPVIAALRGRKFVDSSRTHHRVQTATLVLLAALPILILSGVALDRWNRGRMPNYVRIAGGLDGGVYDDFSGEIARRISRSHGVDATIVKSEGSLQNRSRLLEGELHLAPLQASTVRGENLCVVAPLFYELVHVLVRPDAGIASIEQMRGRTIAVGPDGSGSRLAAELLFDSHGLGMQDLNVLVLGWGDLDRLGQVEGAIVCIGTDSPLVSEMLRSGTFRILEIPDSLKVSADHPTLRPLRIAPSHYAAGLIPEGGIETVGMPAFLAARFDTPAVLVRAALDAIYERPPIDDRLIPKRVAAEFQGMQLHPEARRYFNP